MVALLPKITTSDSVLRDEKLNWDEELKTQASREIEDPSQIVRLKTQASREFEDPGQSWDWRSRPVVRLKTQASREIEPHDLVCCLDPNHVVGENRPSWYYLSWPSSGEWREGASIGD